MGKEKTNGHIKQLKPDQQLVLAKIQRRVLQHRDEARGQLDQAQAAYVELQAAISAHVKSLGIDLATVDFDLDKLQFTKKGEPA
jgi:hypothetical protein